MNGFDTRAAAAELPTGGQVVAGKATIQQINGQTVVIDQNTPKAVINWNSFGIGSSESVVFRQPASSSVALNRVTGSDPSLIFGTLQANGQVFLVNPNGMLFGRGASVNVGGLVASTLGISNQDFLAGRYQFAADVRAGSVVNEGTIRASDGGYVAVLGNQVNNRGTIVANRGTVGIAAGDAMLLDFHGDGLLSLKVNAAAAGARIDHSGVIQADGGKVLMTAQAKNALLSTVLNIEGIVTARSMVERNGAIYLDGGQSGVTRVSGILDVSSAHAGARGGEIRALGEYVGLFDNATLSASGPAGGGTVLVGGDFQGKNVKIPNAQGTFVARDARIVADSTESGNGGKIVVWSDGSTKFYGHASARGGAKGGDGGLVEVSGKKNLAFRGSVDTTAEKGKIGTLLLDPDAIQIRGGVNDGNDFDDSDSSFMGSFCGPTGTVTLNDSTPTFIYESEIEETSKSANIMLEAVRSITIDNAPFNHNSGNPGDVPSGALALAANRSLTLRTRNNGIEETGSIDLAAGFHGANLSIAASGTGSMTIVSGSGNNAGAQAPIRLPRLQSGTAGVTVTADGTQAGTVTISGISTTQPGQPGGPVSVRSQAVGGSCGCISIVEIDTRGGTPGAGQPGMSGGSVDLAAGSISVGAINTSGSSAVDASENSGGAGGSLSFSGGNITLLGDVSARGGNAASLITRNGAPGGAVSFNGTVAVSPVVSAVTVSSAGGLGTFGGDAGTGGNITVNGQIISAFPGGAKLALNAGSGTVSFLNISGLADLDITGGLITFTGSGPFLPVLVSATAPGGNTVTFNGPLVNPGDLTVDVGSNNVTFNGTVNSRVFSGGQSTSGPFSLTVNSAGTTTFGGAVGNTQRLQSLATDRPGMTSLSSASISTVGGQEYLDPVILGANAALSSSANGLVGGSITFFGSINADNAANRRTLNITAGAGSVVLGEVGNNQPLGGLAIASSQLSLNGNVRLDRGGALDLSNVADVLFAPGTVLDTDAPGGTSAAGLVRFGPTTTLRPTGPGSLTIDATADNGGNAGGVDLGSAGGGLTPIAVLTVSGELIRVSGNVTADRIVLTGNEVRTPGNGLIAATRPFSDFDPANAALTLRGLSTSGTFGQPPPGNALNVDVPGILILEPNASDTLPAVWLRGDPAKAPVYEFAATLGRREVCYNGVCLGVRERRIERLLEFIISAQEQTALSALLDQLRKLLDELLMAGFSRENIRKQLVQRIVLEAGRGRPGIDEFTGEGVTAPTNCEARTDMLDKGVLACQ